LLFIVIFFIFLNQDKVQGSENLEIIIIF